MYSVADLVPNENYDSGLLATAATAKAADAEKARQAAEATAAQATGPVTSDRFVRKINTQAKSNNYASPYGRNGTSASSADYCEQTCRETKTCNVFTYWKGGLFCYLYSAADLVPNDGYDSGIRE
jgi:hypothetical protein